MKTLNLKEKEELRHCIDMQLSKLDVYDDSYETLTRIKIKLGIIEQ